MSSINVSNVDARHGTFNNANNAGQNIIVNTNDVQIVYEFSLFGRRQPPVVRPAINHLPLPVSGADTLIPSRRILRAETYRSSDAVLAIDDALGLLVRIAHLLVDRGIAPSDDRPDLKYELNSLYQSLVLAKNGIQVYDDKPLGRVLANAITPVVNQCTVALQDLFEIADGTREGLDPTRISPLWLPVWWRRWDTNELTSLKHKLIGVQTPLRAFFVALHSCN